MTTPICDFVRKYAEEAPVRLHMPGHKGVSVLGVEALDITEVAGADVLYDAHGVILQSEQNASRLFGTAKTLYSTEGSSLSIRAMLMLACLFAKEQGRAVCRIAAGRNAHKTLLSAAALLDLEIDWLFGDDLLSCRCSADTVEEYFRTCGELPAAVYLTSPDYLGNTVDIAAIAKVCHERGVLLLVDNAHGAYLKFLPTDTHPITLGADACCDSAHKTLPALTGCGYLHLSERAPKIFSEQAEAAMSLFASTSPSYLFLQSLDALNRRLSERFSEELSTLCQTMEVLRADLSAHGYELCGDEPTKLTVAPKSYGYMGEELSAILAEQGIVCEFCDRDFLVMMMAPENISRVDELRTLLLEIPRRAPIGEIAPVPSRALRAMSVREATFANRERLPVDECLGRVMASMSVSCPPAVPVAVCGEIIDEQTITCLKYYGITECEVVRTS
ncbi:MAG: aminotransferase class V-fold PLP-dependent enzyme [Clostridia bacterium]|nr:aminotransferase class V-fold PLP-dependent enzyme [Clostridia bacterium]